MQQNKLSKKTLDLPKSARKPDAVKPAAARKGKSASSAFLFSPVFNVVVLVMLMLAVFGGLRYMNWQKSAAQVKFVERENFDSTENNQKPVENFLPPEIFGGEVYSTSVRLRETGALGMAMTLAVFGDFAETKRLPENLEQIRASVSKRKLLPPGLEFKSNALQSGSSVFTVRYQREPLRFEILARPKPEQQSPALLMRFPLPSLDDKTITYFQSSSVSVYDIPPPFAPLDKVVAAGWTIEQWRGELLPKSENSRQMLEEEKRLLNEIQPAKR